MPVAGLISLAVLTEEEQDRSMQDAARRGQRGTHRCNSPLGVANSSPCLLAHPAGYIMDNCTRLDTAILHLRALYDVQISLAQKV